MVIYSPRTEGAIYPSPTATPWVKKRSSFKNLDKYNHVTFFVKKQEKFIDTKLKWI